jgi:hypothetical protein
LKLLTLPTKYGEDDGGWSEAGETSDTLALMYLIHVDENRAKKNGNASTYSSPVSKRNFVGERRYSGLTRVTDAATTLE